MFGLVVCCKDVGEERAGGGGGRLRRTISPVCGGPWRGRGTLAPPGCCCCCCCLLRLNSSYTLDMCRAARPTEQKGHMALASGSEGERIANICA